MREDGSSRHALGTLERLPPEVRGIIYCYLIPPPMPLPTRTSLQKIENKTPTGRAWSELGFVFGLRRNPLNIMAASRAIYMEVKALPALRDRIYSVVLTRSGMSCENSMAAKDRRTSDRLRIKRCKLEKPYRALHSVSPKHLDVTFPVPIDESVTGINDVRRVIGDAKVALSDLLNLLKHDETFQLSTLQIRIFLFGQQESRSWTATPPTGAASSIWAEAMLMTLIMVFPVSKRDIKKLSIEVAVDQTEGNQLPWWRVGMEEVAKAIVEYKRELTETQTLNSAHYVGEIEIFTKQVMKRVQSRIIEAKTQWELEHHK